jgi:peroxidase
VNNIDAWVGMLAEDHVRGSSTGPTMRAVLVDQFTRLRDGDGFWYQRTFTGQTLQNIQNTTLADVIRRNTNLTNLQSNVFFFRVQVSGTVFADVNRDGRLGRGEGPLAGRMVQLVDAVSGDLVASTTSDARGHYSFDVGDGLGLGRYTVRVVTPSGQVQTTPATVISLTRGDMFVRFDVGVAGASHTVAAATPSNTATDAVDPIDLTTDPFAPDFAAPGWRSG